MPRQSYRQTEKRSISFVLNGLDVARFWPALSKIDADCTWCLSKAFETNGIVAGTEHELPHSRAGQRMTRRGLGHRFWLAWASLQRASNACDANLPLQLQGRYKVMVAIRRP